MKKDKTKEKNLNRVYYNHEDWEDFKAGMFDTKNLKNEDELISNAKALLSNQIELYKYMKEVSLKWEKSCEANFTNTGCNRQAWLGQATCFYRHKVPEQLTKIAWNQLNEKQQEEANKIADKVIDEWENRYSKGGIKNAKKTFKVKCLRSE